MRILFIVPYTPTRIRTRPLHLIRALIEAGHELTVVTLWTTAEELREFLEIIENRSLVLCEEMSRVRSMRNCFRGLVSRVPLQASYSWKPTLAQRLAALLTAQDYDVVHVEHLRGARYVLRVQEVLLGQGKSQIPVVWDSVDCISALFEQAARESRSLFSRSVARLELGRTRRYEGRLVRRVDRVVVTSEIDRSKLLHLASRFAPRNGSSGDLKTRITVVPNGVDLDYFHPLDGERERAALVVSGKMSYHANETAVVAFIREAMPRIWAERPDVQLWVAGKDPSRRIRELKSDRVVITGTVPDIRPFLQHASIAVAPIQYGAGIQNKVLEALACGTPVVATPQAVAGLSIQPGVHLVVGHGMEGLAEATLGLLNNPGQRRYLGKSGRYFVETHHNWGSVAGLLEDVYREARFEATHSRL
ncbi:MAG: glycosyltransferase family 4 protein [Acidobacteriota bacterium]